MSLKKIVLVALIVLIATEAFAASAFRTTMNLWRDHQKATAGMIAGHAPMNDAAIRAMLTDYVAGSEKLEAGLSGSSAEVKDMHARFAALRAEASAALASVGDNAAVKQHVARIFSACKGCHDAYQN